MKPNTYFLSGLITGALLSAVGIGLWYTLGDRRTEALESHTDSLEKRIRQQDALIDSLERRSYSGLLDQLIQRMDTELKQNPEHTLSDETIGRMVSLSYTFKPYNLREGDTLSSRKLSPERGKMLLFISNRHLDSASLRKVYSRVSFAGADLRDAEMQGSDLRGANLEGADFYGARLQGALLDQANLKGSNFWGANLRGATCVGANLKGADVRWADLQDTRLEYADLTEADLSASQLRNANLRHAVMQWTDLTGAFLQSARLDSSDMFRATLKKANLEKTNLFGVNLTLANITEAILTETNMTGANLSEIIVSGADWISRLKDWKVTGASEIETTYTVVPANTTGELFYQVKKK